MAAYTVSVIDPLESVNIPVKVIVFGSLTRNATVIIQHQGINGPSLDNSIDGSAGTKTLHVPGSIDSNCMMSMIIVNMITNDPLVELKGNLTASITIVKPGIILQIVYACCSTSRSSPYII